MLPFQNGLQYRNSDFNRLDRINLSTVCTILVTFGTETLEFTLLTIALFVVIWQKLAYHAKYLRMSWTYFDLFYSLAGALVGMIFQIFVWRSPKRHCYGNQLSMGDVRKHCEERPLSLLWHSTTNWPIVNLFSKDSMAIIRLHRIQIWWTSVQ